MQDVPGHLERCALWLPYTSETYPRSLFTASFLKHLYTDSTYSPQHPCRHYVFTALLYTTEHWLAARKREEIGKLEKECTWKVQVWRLPCS